MERTIKILSLNVNGLASDLKRYRLNNLAKGKGIDILCLQETHKAKKDLRPLLNNKVWKMQYESRGTNKARGVAILINSRLNISLLEQNQDREGRFIFLKFSMDGKKYTLVNIYAPNQGQTKFLNQVFQKIQLFYEGNLIIAGDFNNDIMINKKLKLKKWRLIEVYNLLQKEKQPTYFSNRYKKFSIIDHVLVKETNDMEVKDIDTGTIWLSDHAPLIISIRQMENQRERRWRFNSRIFFQQKDEEELRREIQLYFIENKGSAEEGIVWDTAKAVIRGICINKEIYFRRNINMKRDQKLKEIAETQKKLQRKLEKQTQEHLSRLKEELQELDNLSLWKKDILVKNQYQRISISTMKRLANYLKKRKERQMIGCMIDEKGTKRYKDKQIREIFEKFYKKLFKAENVKQFEEDVGKKLNKQELVKLNAEITQQEIIEVIKKLKNGKTPGLDGIGAKFYKMVVNEIVQEMQNLFNGILKGGITPNSWKKS